MTRKLLVSVWTEDKKKIDDNWDKIFKKKKDKKK